MRLDLCSGQREKDREDTCTSHMYQFNTGDDKNKQCNVSVNRDKSRGVATHVLSLAADHR